ncbi:TadE family protein [Aggregatilinea lenta]|uniref:TadE family protein n=1 Tax=Aggregatilinea lenta TaxID=913108 RepID=UPI000E5A47E8|nr:TadE family protein [Aggregatilinea lenta]
MRARYRRMLAILDGAPTGARGQSLVELTLTVPILLVMLMGLVEVGWFANNYMVLLDNVREAGRRGAVLDPLTDWEAHQEKVYHRMDCENTDQYFNTGAGDNGILRNSTDGWPWKDLGAYGYVDGTEHTSAYGFYDDVACLILRNMAPLDFDSTTDDIIISVFSYAVIDPNPTDDDPSDKVVRVIGRFPPDTNECSGEPDPFDWRGAGLLDPPDGDATDDGEFYESTDGNTPYYDATSDEVRGFVMRGNHVAEDDAVGLPCLGSDFSTAEVQNLLNFNNITDPTEHTDKIDNTRKFGMVLVEMDWKHRQLFGMPWFNLGPLNNGPYVHVWTFFPVSGAELDLQDADLDPAYFQ